MMSIDRRISPNARQDQQAWKGQEDPHEDAQEAVPPCDTAHLTRRGDGDGGFGWTVQRDTAEAKAVQIRIRSGSHRWKLSIW